MHEIGIAIVSGYHVSVRTFTKIDFMVKFT
jgi:hypothetical protein